MMIDRPDADGGSPAVSSRLVALHQPILRML